MGGMSGMGPVCKPDWTHRLAPYSGSSAYPGTGTVLLWSLQGCAACTRCFTALGLCCTCSWMWAGVAARCCAWSRLVVGQLRDLGSQMIGLCGSNLRNLAEELVYQRCFLLPYLNEPLTVQVCFQLPLQTGEEPQHHQPVWWSSIEVGGLPPPPSWCLGHLPQSPLSNCTAVLAYSLCLLLPVVWGLLQRGFGLGLDPLDTTTILKAPNLDWVTR